MSKPSVSKFLPSNALAHGLFSPGVASEYFFSPHEVESDCLIEIFSSSHTSFPIKQPSSEMPKVNYGESYKTTPSCINHAYENEWYRQLELIKPFVCTVEYEFGYWLNPKLSWPPWVHIYSRLNHHKEHLKSFQEYFVWEELFASVEAAVNSYRLPKSFGGLPDLVDREVWVGELVYFAQKAATYHSSSFLLLRRLFIHPLLLILNHFRLEHKIAHGGWIVVELKISSTELLASPRAIRADLMQICEYMSVPSNDAFDLFKRSLCLGNQMEIQWCKADADVALKLLLANVGSPSCRIFALGIDLPEVSQFPLELSDGRIIHLPFPPWRAAYTINPVNDSGE